MAVVEAFRQEDAPRCAASRETEYSALHGLL